MAIEIRNLSKRFGEQQVLSHLNLTLEDRHAYCLMAPSGSGKTTLFRILLGLEKADSGSIGGLAGKRISAVFQEDRLLEEFSVIQNLAFAAGGRFASEDLKRLAGRLLPDEALKKPVRTFSGGMKRRAAILRALAAPAEVLLFDEPFAGLDEQTKLRTIGLIREYSVGKILLAATHDPGDAALLQAEVLTL